MNNHFLDSTLPEPLPDDPMQGLQQWLDDAYAKNARRNPNAMTLATVDANGRPSARVVLCKHIEPDPGYLVFYTNYRSRKGLDIEACNRVSVVFHWDSLGRQARLDGMALRSPAAESDAYFATRGRGSQLGAWGSDQSQPIESRAALRQQIEERAVQLGYTRGEPLRRPSHWGGYRVWPTAIELWIEGGDRVHDRARWQRTLDDPPTDSAAYVSPPWRGTRLQP